MVIDRHVLAGPVSPVRAEGRAPVILQGRYRPRIGLNIPTRQQGIPCACTGGTKGERAGGEGGRPRGTWVWVNPTGGQEGIPTPGTRGRTDMLEQRASRPYPGRPATVVAGGYCAVPGGVQWLDC